MLLVDNEVPYADAGLWPYWLKERRAELPRPRRPQGKRRSRRTAPNTSCARGVVHFDPLAQRATREMQAFMWRDGELVAEEEYVLTTTLYFRDEIVLMLERAGFAEVSVRGPYNDAAPAPDDDFLVYSPRAMR